MSKRLVLFVLVGLWAVVLGFFVLSPVQAVTAVRNQGVWFIAAAMAGLAFYGFREMRAWWAAGLDGGRRTVNWGALAVILGGAGFMQLHEPHGFKIVSDEVLLSSTAKQIHEVREASTVLRAYEYAGNFVALNTRVDKRPLTFPVLLAGVHAVAGYRFENVFWLNGLLGAALTGLLYLMGRRLAGFWGGVAAVAWGCTVPLVVQNVTGGVLRS